MTHSVDPVQSCLRERLHVRPRRWVGWHWVPLVLIWVGTSTSHDLRASESAEVGSAEWIRVRASAAEAYYQQRRLGAASRELTSLVAFASEALLARFRGALPVPTGRSYQRSDAGHDPSPENVASGIFRLVREYRSKDGGGIEISLEGVESSEADALIEAVKSSPKGDSYRLGDFVGVWSSDVLSIPLAYPAPGSRLRIALRGSLVREEATSFLTESTLGTLSALSLRTWRRVAPVPQQFLDLKAKIGPQGVYPNSLLWRSKSIIEMIRAEWIEGLLATLRAADPTLRLGDPRVIVLNWTTPGTIVTGEGVADGCAIDYVVSSNVGDDEVRRRTGRSAREEEWRESESRGLRFWHLHARQAGSEEVLVPGWESRTRVWLRSRVSGEARARPRCTVVDRINMESLRSYLDDAP